MKNLTIILSLMLMITSSCGRTSTPKRPNYMNSIVLAQVDFNGVRYNLLRDPNNLPKVSIVTENTYVTTLPFNLITLLDLSVTNGTVYILYVDEYRRSHIVDSRDMIHWQEVYRASTF